ncbi:MAG: 30S ribosomal protein S20 [Holosporales bacterium]|jgi:small subunit ribosomal protein S20|nr:30S ribosomal protein S20 [Holosporales bacterium]
MASHESAKKSIRKTARQRVVNINRLSRIRTFIKKLESALAGKLDKDAVLSAFSAAQKEIMRGVGKRVIHKNTAARKISRMNKRVKLVIGEVAQ